MCRTTRESRVVVAHVVTLYVVVRSWVIDKQAKKIQLFKLLLVKHHLAWGWSYRRTIADVDELSKKRQLFIFGVPCVRLLSDDED